VRGRQPPGHPCWQGLEANPTPLHMHGHATRAALNLTQIACTFVPLTHSLPRSCSPVLRREMEYCQSHPEEMSRMAAVQQKVDEVKGIMVQNVSHPGASGSSFIMQRPGLKGYCMTRESASVAARPRCLARVCRQWAGGRGLGRMPKAWLSLLGWTAPLRSLQRGRRR
jgi:hypothetical protein